MEYSENICFNIEISPSDLDNFNLKKFLKNKFAQNIYKGVYIVNIIKVCSYEFGKINENGDICIYADTSCLVVNPKIGDSMSIVVSSSNKMGAFYSNNSIKIFIPKQFAENIPNQGDVVNIEIIGKRIETCISCIAKIKQEA
jgi:DNA-directed RNA polymerase subunit E'/Rpb7